MRKSYLNIFNWFIYIIAVATIQTYEVFKTS